VPPSGTGSTVQGKNNTIFLRSANIFKDPLKVCTDSPDGGRIRPGEAAFPRGRPIRTGLLCLLCLALVLFTFHGCKTLRPAAKPEPVADSAIASGIKGRIAEEGLPPVRVFVLEGRVTLSGSVPSQEIREKIITIAKSVKGVLLVTADLQLQKIR